MLFATGRVQGWNHPVEAGAHQPAVARQLEDSAERGPGGDTGVGTT